MSRGYNYSKHICDYTCPAIDEVIAFIKNYDESYVDDMIKNLETIRSANDALRKWGNQLSVELEDKEDEIKDLKRELNQI